MTLRPRAATLLAAAVGLLLGACGGSLYDAAGVPKVAGGDQCNADQHLCPATGNVCQNHDVDHCGTACAVCAAPHAAATASCEPVAGDHQCDFSCAAGWFKAGGTCQRVAAGPGALSAGAHHTCAVTEGGALVCWGLNDAGQLGVAGGGGIVPALALPSGVTAVAAGGQHTCAVQAGVVKCFGANGSGQLGRAGAGGALPAAVTGGPAGVVALAAGAAHTCALTGGGAVHCWGANEHGQVGDGSLTTPVAPKATSILSGVSELSATTDTSCALQGSQVRCWGANARGQADGATAPADVRTPALASLPGPAVGVAAGGQHACAILSGTAVPQTDDGLWCWGDHSEAQLGTGDPPSATPALAPVRASKIDNTRRSIQSIAGGAFTCTAKDPTGLKCGGANDQGQAGGGVTPMVDGADVSFGGNVVHSDAGLDHGCATVDVTPLAAPTHVVKCWGRNAEGQLGRFTSATGASDGAPATVGP